MMKTINEEHIRKIVAESLMNLLQEEGEEQQPVIGTYYTVTTYHNGKKGDCVAFKSLKLAKRYLREDFEEYEYERDKWNMSPSHLETVEWMNADEYFDEDDIAAELGRPVKKRRGRPKARKTMNNEGFIAKYRDGYVFEEYLGEEEGNIAELEAADRFSDDVLDHKFRFSKRFNPNYAEQNFGKKPKKD